MSRTDYPSGGHSIVGVNPDGEILLTFVGVPENPQPFTHIYFQTRADLRKLYTLIGEHLGELEPT